MNMIQEAISLMTKEDIRELYDNLFETEYVVVSWKIANSGCSCRFLYTDYVDEDEFESEWNGYDFYMEVERFKDEFDKYATKEQRLYYASLSDEYMEEV